MSCTELGAARAQEKPELVHRLSIRADLGPAVEFPTTQGTLRAVFPIIGGQVIGKGISGTILPGGADFARGLPDHSYEIEARYCIMFQDGTTVMITNAGRMYPQPDGSYLGRTRATFDAPPGPFSWLADGVFFGTALSERDDDERVFIELWEARV